VHYEGGGRHTSSLVLRTDHTTIRRLESTHAE
jgi:fructose-1,6-bisphosphatase/sedoheptulose 1,7-bisphosphatase-like protein